MVASLEGVRRWAEPAPRAHRRAVAAAVGSAREPAHPRPHRRPRHPTRALCDVPSVSGDERALADAVESALRLLPHLEVLRDGDAVVARTHLGRTERVVVAGHLDTVPPSGNLPSQLRGSGQDAQVWGRGTVDTVSYTHLTL